VAAARAERLVVALVRGLHGLRGAVRLEILSDDPDRFRPGSVLHPEGASSPLTIEWAHRDGPGLLVRFAEIPSREAAEQLRDRYLEIDATGESLPEGAWYWHEVEGARVTTTDGRELGTVHEVFRAGENEVFVVRGGKSGEVLIPAVRAVIVEMAPREGRIVVDADALALDEPDEQPRPRGRRSVNAARRGRPLTSAPEPEGGSDAPGS
jgi:16S rRNA processing protein RimM